MINFRKERLIFVATFPRSRVWLEDGFVRKKYSRSQTVVDEIAFYDEEYLDKSTSCSVDFLNFRYSKQLQMLHCTINNCCIECEISDGVLTTFYMDGDEKRIVSQVFVLPFGSPITGTFSATMHSNSDVFFSFSNQKFRELLHDKEIYIAYCMSPNRAFTVQPGVSFILTDGKKETKTFDDGLLSVTVSDATYSIFAGISKQNGVLTQYSKLFCTVNPSEIQLPSCKAEFVKLIAANHF